MAADAKGRFHGADFRPDEDAALKAVRTQSGPNRDHAISPAHRALLAPHLPLDLRCVRASTAATP